jgi:hypothetical protein
MFLLSFADENKTRIIEYRDQKMGVCPSNNLIRIIGVIVTVSLRDFPANALVPYGVAALHPDTFVRGLLNDGPEDVVAALRSQQASLKRPPLSVDELFAIFHRLGLVETVVELQRLMKN